MNSYELQTFAPQDFPLKMLLRIGTKENKLQNVEMKVEIFWGVT